MWPNSQFPGDLVTFTQEILNGNLHILCSDGSAYIREIEKIEKLFRKLSKLVLKPGVADRASTPYQLIRIKKSRQILVLLSLLIWGINL